MQGVSPDTGELEDVGALYVDGTEYTSWSDAAEREQQATVTVADLLAGDQDLEFHIGPGEPAEDITDEADRQAGRLVRRWSALDGVIRMHAERVAGPYQALRLRLRLENTSTPRAEFAVREDGLRHAMIAAHVLIARARRPVPVHDRPARVGRGRGVRVREHRHLAGAGRPARLP